MDKDPDFTRDFNEFIETLQSEIHQKELEDFSSYALELGNAPYHYGKLTGENIISAANRSGCGDLLTIYLQIEDTTIKDVGFEVDGCVLTVIAGAQTMKMVHNLTIEQAKQISAQMIYQALGKFPLENFHCCALGYQTLHNALEKYEKYEQGVN